MAKFSDLELSGSYLTARSYNNVVIIEAAQGDYGGWSELGEIDVESLYNWLGEWLAGRGWPHW